MFRAILYKKNRMLQVFACLTFVSSFWITHSFAAGVDFTAKVTAANSCTVVVKNHGAMGLSADKKTLSSKIPGGSFGQADVFSNGAFKLYAETSGKFSIFPPTGNIGTVLSSFFSGSGIQNSRNFVEQSGAVPITLRSGSSITRLKVNLVATRSGSAFPGGHYQGIVVIRCE
jgi:hypothetical protein